MPLAVIVANFLNNYTEPAVEPVSRRKEQTISADRKEQTVSAERKEGTIQ